MRATPLSILFKASADFTAFLAAFCLAFLTAQTYSHLVRGVDYIHLNSKDFGQHSLIFGIFALAVIFVFYSKGHYSERFPWWHQVRQVVIAGFTAMLIQGFLHYVLKYPLSRLWVGGTWLMAVPLILFARLAVRAVLKRMGRWSIPATIIGGTENALETAFALHSDSYADYQLRRIVILTGKPIDKADLPPRYKNVEVVTGIQEAQKALKKANRFLILAPDESTLRLTDQMMLELRDSGKDYALVPPTMGVSVYDTRPRYFFGHNVVLFHPNQPRGRPHERALKRLMDVTASGLGLLALAPLFVVIALLIKKQAPGSKVFFGHKRVGQGGKAFSCYKFTSMVPDAGKVLEDLLAKDPEARKEWQKDFKLKNDPRITRIGRILRATSLDELPQLWNVFKGDMSLVGPRPIVEDETKYYGKNLADYLVSKPGITGLWQVSGRNDTTYAYRVYLDSWYARHWSLWHDIVILFETVKIVINRKGAY